MKLCGSHGLTATKLVGRPARSASVTIDAAVIAAKMKDQMSFAMRVDIERTVEL